MTSRISIYLIAFTTALLPMCCCEPASTTVKEQQELDRSVIGNNRQHYLDLVFFYDIDVQQKYEHRLNSYLSFLQQRVAYILTHRTIGQAFNIGFLDNHPLPWEETRRWKTESRNISELMKKFQIWVSDLRSFDRRTINIYITRKFQKGTRPSTVGLAQLSQMCIEGAPRIGIVDDDGPLFGTELTIVHEVGHVLGLEHANIGGMVMNTIHTDAMSSNLPVWNEKSRNALQKWIDQGVFDCTLSPSPGINYDVNRIASMYDVSLYRFFTYDVDRIVLAQTCRYIERQECKRLICYMHVEADGLHKSLHLSVPMGYPCGDPLSKGCYNQRCENLKELTTVDGGWTDWSSFTRCSKRCGGGVKTRRRNCTMPLPQYGGRYCIGDFVHTQTCNNQQCPAASYGSVSVRQNLCYTMQYNTSANASSNEPFVELILSPNDDLKSACNEVKCKGVADGKVRFYSMSIPSGEQCFDGHRNRGSKCFNRRCLQVGCNGYYDSMLPLLSLPQMDKCGNCENGYERCRHASFTKTIRTVDSNDEVINRVRLDSLPVGAKNVQIVDLTPRRDRRDEPYLILYLGEQCLLNCDGIMDSMNVHKRSNDVWVKYSGLKKSSRWIHIEDQLTDDLSIYVYSNHKHYRDITLHISYWMNNLPIEDTACRRKCHDEKTEILVYPNGTEWSPTWEYDGRLRLKQIDVHCDVPCQDSESTNAKGTWSWAASMNCSQWCMKNTNAVMPTLCYHFSDNGTVTREHQFEHKCLEKRRMIDCSNACGSVTAIVKANHARYVYSIQNNLNGLDNDHSRRDQSDPIIILSSPYRNIHAFQAFIPVRDGVVDTIFNRQELDVDRNLRRELILAHKKKYRRLVMTNWKNRKLRNRDKLKRRHSINRSLMVDIHKSPQSRILNIFHPTPPDMYRANALT